MEDKTIEDTETTENNIQSEFYSLLDKWKKETMGMSTIDTIVMHPAYQRIIEMGKDVLPYIFKELKECPVHFIYALEAITGADPADSEDNGIEKVTEAWLQWAKDNDYIK